MKDLKYYKDNCEENYLTTPISVLRYIGELERGIINRGLIIAVLLNLCFLFFMAGILIGKNN